MAEDQRKAELTAELARARRRIAGNVGALRTDLDIATRAKQAFRKSPAAWLGGAAILGLLVAKLPARRKKISVQRGRADSNVANAGKAGLLLTALKIGFDLARPALLKWAGQRVAQSMDAHRADRYAPR